MKRTQKVWHSIPLTLLIALTVVAGFHPESGAQQFKNTKSLKVALLPILDAFPFYVAESEGYFADDGVAVKAVPVASGLERDQLMQSGTIDGMLNEMITTANFNRNRLRVKSVLSARKAYPDFPLFRILSAPGSRVTSTRDLAGVPIGAASIIAAVAYSGGPYPLASHGLGDLFVFVFFGLVAVCGTYYVQALTLTPLVVMMGVIVGFLITAILVVNNLRDIQTDRKTGKRTLAVMIGEKRTRAVYTALLGSAYVITGFIWIGGFASTWLLLPLASLPLAFLQIRLIWHTSEGPALNNLLAQTAKLSFFFSVLLSIGLILS